jgi:membrane protease YdiL (CAAX protease family)
MSEPSPGRTPEWTPSAPRGKPFSILVTAVCSIVAVVYLGVLGRPLIEPLSSPLSELERPADSLERLVARELDLRAAMRGGRGWEWRLYRVLSGDEDPVAEAAGWYDELLETIDSPSAELQRAILLAESGHAAGAREALARWTAAGAAGERMAGWVAAAYLGAPPAWEDGRAALAEIDGELAATWFSDTLARRIAARIGDASARSRAEAAILARGRELLLRARVLMAASAALLALGLIALGWMLARRASARVGDAPLPPAWSPADGYALFVRGLGAPQAIALLVFVALRRETGLGTALGMAADLPLFWWILRYLWTRGGSARATFGLGPRRDGWAPLLGVALALVAAGIAGDALIEAARGFVHVKTHWTDGLTEELLWASPRRALLEALDATVWAPIVEELTFRGLLYGTLRTRLGAGSSAVLSAVVFTLPHGYAIAGSASVLVSGVLWALAYERTRSLWPGLLAHAANNLLSTLWTLALLR